MNRWFNSFTNRKFTSNEVQAILILFAKGKVLITGDVRTNITELRRKVRFRQMHSTHPSCVLKIQKFKYQMSNLTDPGLMGFNMRSISYPMV